MKDKRIYVVSDKHGFCIAVFKTYNSAKEYIRKCSDRWYYIEEFKLYE